MTTQRPVPPGAIPTNFELNQQQKQQKFPDGILPSGQAVTNVFLQQPFSNEPNSTISKLSSDGIRNPLSSTNFYDENTDEYKISDVPTSGVYIHYYDGVKIPYISSFKTVLGQNPYQ